MVKRSPSARYAVSHCPMRRLYMWRKGSFRLLNSESSTIQVTVWVWNVNSRGVSICCFPLPSLFGGGMQFHSSFSRPSGSPNFNAVSSK